MFTLAQLHAHFGRKTDPVSIARDFFNSSASIRRRWRLHLDASHSFDQILVLEQLTPEICLETLGIALAMEGGHIDPLLAFIVDVEKGIYSVDQPIDSGLISFVRNGVIKAREYGFKLLRHPYSLLTEGDDYAHMKDPEDRLPAQQKLKEHLLAYTTPKLYTQDDDGGWYCRNLRLYLAIYPDKLVKPEIQVHRLLHNGDVHFGLELAEQVPLPEPYDLLVAQNLRHYEYRISMVIREKVLGHQVMGLPECKERLDEALDDIHREEGKSKRVELIELIKEMCFPAHFEGAPIQKVVDDFFREWLGNSRVGNARPGTFEYLELFEALRLKGHQAHYLGLTLSRGMNLFEVWEFEATGVSLLPSLVKQLGERQVQFVSNALGCAVMQYPIQEILEVSPNDKALRHLYEWTKDEAFLHALSPEGCVTQLESDLGL
jgi:hypothetical protein